MDIRNQVESLFNVKRQKKLTQAGENYRKILQANPDLQDIEDEMLEASQEVALTGVYDEEKMDAISAKKDKLLKDLGLEGADKPKFDCNICEDRGYVDGKVCQCLKKELINAYFNLGENGGIIKDNNFANFDIEIFDDQAKNGSSPRANMEKIYELSRKYAANFENEEDSLFFYGPSGTGKTYLTGCIASEIRDRGFTVLYLTAIELMNFCRDRQFNSADNKDYMDQKDQMIKTCDLLIIDDLGTEQANNMNAGYLYDIINYRTSVGKKFIINSNLSLMDLSKRYADRIFSRITGNSKNIEFIGSNLRMKR